MPSRGGSLSPSCGLKPPAALTRPLLATQGGWGGRRTFSSVRGAGADSQSPPEEDSGCSCGDRRVDCAMPGDTVRGFPWTFLCERDFGARAAGDALLGRSETDAFTTESSLLVLLAQHIA